MKKVFAVFAHPDDEGFGPSCTLMKEIDDGAEVHLITLTCGNAGANPDNVPDLGAVREEEWREAGRLIGAASMHHLGYRDGELCNGAMIEVADTVQTIIQDATDDNDEIELMSFEPGGISGHIDHIVASRASHQVFYRLKSHGAPVTRLRLFCVTDHMISEPDTAWVFMDKGYSADEIDEVLDVSEYVDRHIAIIKAHRSQREDGAVHLARIEQNGHTKYDHFIIRT